MQKWLKLGIAGISLLASQVHTAELQLTVNGQEPADMVSELEVKEALQCIVDNRQAKALNYAVNYAREGLLLTGEALHVQLLYILGNMTGWRGEDAKQVRTTLKAITKQKD